MKAKKTTWLHMLANGYCLLFSPMCAFLTGSLFGRVTFAIFKDALTSILVSASFLIPAILFTGPIRNWLKKEGKSVLDPYEVGKSKEPESFEKLIESKKEDKEKTAEEIARESLELIRSTWYEAKGIIARMMVCLDTLNDFERRINKLEPIIYKKTVIGILRDSLEKLKQAVYINTNDIVSISVASGNSFNEQTVTKIEKEVVSTEELVKQYDSMLQDAIDNATQKDDTFTSIEMNAYASAIQNTLNPSKNKAPLI